MSPVERGLTIRRRRARHAGRALALALVLATGGPAGARERIDTVLLAGGDRVTGEIVALQSANLTVRSRAFGTVEVDWPDVMGLVSVQAFEVERKDGTRFVGRLDTTEPPDRTLIVRFGAETEPVTIPFADVVDIHQTGTRFWHGRRGHLDIGWTYAQASRDSNFTLDAELALRGRKLASITTLESTISSDSGEQSSRRDVLESRLEVPLGRRLLGLGWAGHERNDDLDLRSRDSVGGVLGWIPAQGARGRLFLGPGIGESHESYFSRDHESVVTSAVLLFSADYHRFGRFGTRARFTAVWFPVFSGPDRDRVELRASLRQKVGSDFHVGVSPYYSYDSNPPSLGAPGEDWGWTTSLGWDF